jgi:hypothetical protein
LKIASEDQLKKGQQLEAESSVEMATVGKTAYIRERDGTWRYADTWLKVPGARDLTLTERFQPKFILTGPAEDAQIERVIVSGADVEAHPLLLGWCLQSGMPVRGAEGELLEVLVPYEQWRKGDRIPGEIVAPELHGDSAERALAEAQRRYQEAEQALDEAAALRVSVLQQYAGELTRERAREITGLSVGRVQQLIKSEIELDSTDKLLLLAVGKRQPKSEEAVRKALIIEFGHGYPRGLVKIGLRKLRELDLIDLTRSKGYVLTAEGQEAVAAIEASGFKP